MHNFGGRVVTYLSDIPYEQLASEDTTDNRLGLRFGIRRMFKLYLYVTFLSDCIILVVANDISNLGSKIISYIWGVVYITITSDFSDSKVNKSLILDLIMFLFALNLPGLVQVCSL